MKNKCDNCGKLIPSHVKLCPNCYLEYRQQQKESRERLHKNFDKENQRFLYGQ